MSDSLQVQMAQAVRRQMDQADLSKQKDRTGWTRKQWVDDARNLMGHTDGAITSLVNGHVMALLDEVDRLEGAQEALSQANAEVDSLQHSLSLMDDEVAGHAGRAVAYQDAVHQVRDRCQWQVSHGEKTIAVAEVLDAIDPLLRLDEESGG